MSLYRRTAFRKFLFPFLSVNLLFSACTTDNDDDDTDIPTIDNLDALIITNSSSAGQFVLVNNDYQLTTGTDLIHYDAVARYNSELNLIFVVNRYGADNIAVIDPENNFEVISQYSTGAGTNPQDIAVINQNKAIVALYDADYLLVVNPLTGEELAKISLSDYTNENVNSETNDGSPEANSVLYTEDYIFATLQRIQKNNYYSTSDYSYILKINPNNYTIEESKKLISTNPFNLMNISSYTKEICLTEMGSSSTDGVVECISPITLESKKLISEIDLGGDIINFCQNAGKGFAVISKDYTSQTLLQWDLYDNQLEIKTLWDSPTYVIYDIQTDPTGILWVTDREESAPSLRLYDTSKETLQYISFEDQLLPSQIVFFE